MFLFIFRFRPEVIQGLSLALFLDSLLKGKDLLYSTVQFLIENKHSLISILIYQLFFPFKVQMT